MGNGGVGSEEPVTWRWTRRVGVTLLAASWMAAAIGAGEPAAPYYSVQLATETSRDNAAGVLRKIAAEPQARIENRRGRWLVRVGAFPTAGDAKPQREALKDRGFADAVIVRVDKAVAWQTADGDSAAAAPAKPKPEAAPEAKPAATGGAVATVATPAPIIAPARAAPVPGSAKPPSGSSAPPKPGTAPKKEDKKAETAKAEPAAEKPPEKAKPRHPPPELKGPAPLRDLELTFRDLGAFDPLQLRGVDGQQTLSFGVRRDEAVVKAKLKLRFTYSPALIRELSHIKVLLNGETLGSLLLPQDIVTTEVQREMEIDPRYFTDFNHLTLQLIGHYTWQCEDAAHSSLWTAINNQSSLELTLRPLTLRPDLALLPSPFFDPRDNRRLDVPFVFPAKASLDMLHAGGVLASWFGAQGSYRSARFPTFVNQLPERHAVVFLMNGQHIDGLDLDDVQAPTLSVVPHPTVPAVQLLVLQGRNADDLNSAAMALVLGQPVLSGDYATVKSVTFAPRRPAYDAPNWARTDRPVKFGELVETLQQLEAYGHIPGAIRVNLRVAPDLWTWNRPGVKVDLHYRYTPPVEVDNSTLTISINDKYIQAVRLPPTEESAKSKLLVPIFGTDTALSSEELLIPAFQVGADNQLQFRFALDYYKRGACRDTDVSQPHSAIDPESTVDLSTFYHYVAMPNLALFANASWPFSKYADLGDTVVVIPDAPSANDIETMLFLVGRMGRQTGTSALRFSLMSAQQVLDGKPDADLLVIGGPAGKDILATWGKSLPAIIERDLRSFAPVNPSKALPPEFIKKETDSATAWNVALQSKGRLAAIMGFESPVKKGRSVVAFASAVPGGLDAAIDAIEDNATVGLIQADLALIHEHTVESFRARDTYYVGHLPFYLLIWHRVSQHAWLVATLGILGGLLIAGWLFGYLKRITARRRSA